MLVLVMGLTYLLSVASIYLRDIHPLWNVIVLALFFISPIFWYVDEVDGILLEILKFNPLGQLIEIAHQVVVFGQVPPLNEWLYTSSIIFGILFFGFFIFKRFENKIVEEI